MSRVTDRPCLSVGIDISTKTGFAVAETDGAPDIIMRSYETISDPKLKGLQRAIWIAGTVMSKIEALPRKPDIVVIEGYGYANAFSLVGLVEIGTLIRVGLLDAGIRAGTMAPNGLKKWVSGSGNAPKSQMILAVFKRFGVHVKDDNQADAIGLATAGLAYFSAINCTKEQLDTVSLISLFSCNTAQPTI